MVFSPTVIFGQESVSNEAQRESFLSAARDMIEAAGNCALITLDDTSIPVVRIMDPFPPDEDFTIWFGTNVKSRKVEQIKKNPNVTLYYQDNDKTGYVVIHAKAQIVDDPVEKKKRWKKAWEDFYPNNREAYTLIKATPVSLEILSESRKILGDSITWKTPVVKF